MPKPKTISMRELSTNAERIATDIDSSGAMYRIKRRGHKTLMLIDEEELPLLQYVDFMFKTPRAQAEFMRLAMIGRSRLEQEYLREQGLDADGRISPARKKATRSAHRPRASKARGRTVRTRARAS
ncbi:MAG TPA: hypothetical protein VL326_06265 [Kofleriaceae bacterium]|jgi:hypothetical protein|nr:hypothetical protein [Kofleriaceae bacterium]